ncbi:hypothetical protein [Pseudonocardia xinjiangensis]|uniref:Uncharacterized protein n=1 Tax=Pseudonocardia xinjiangensis TaxID=75289 RepID=A0ABX1RN40_9PSEU|nr:hypothetical protein [Pseudonocardia xinjiangensis]NMH81309.1 hypothetical protein [Pseudonocardia xinjiangensis]
MWATGPDFREDGTDAVLVTISGQSMSTWDCGSARWTGRIRSRWSKLRSLTKADLGLTDGDALTRIGDAADPAGKPGYPGFAGRSRPRQRTGLPFHLGYLGDELFHVLHRGGRPSSTLHGSPPRSARSGAAPPG